MSMNPLDRVVFAQRVFFFTRHSAKRLVQLATVCSTWHDTISNYGEAIFYCWRCNDERNFNLQFYYVCNANLGATMHFVSQFLAAGASPNTVVQVTSENCEQPDDVPVLVDSVGHPTVVAALLAAGADPDQRDSRGHTPALNAVKKAGYFPVGSVASLHLLVAAGADLNTPSNNHWTPLLWSADYGSLDILAVIIDSGKVGINSTRPACGRSALSCAAQQGHIGACELLLNAGANLNLVNQIDGTTALMGAAHYGHSKCIEFLVAAGGNVDLVHRRGFSALMIVANVELAAERSLECIRVLLAAGADTEICSRVGNTALELAARNTKLSEACRAELIKLLLEHGATVGADEALLAAAGNGDLDCVKLLLGDHVPVKVVIRAFDVAWQHGRVECTSLLQSAVQDRRQSAGARHPRSD